MPQTIDIAELRRRSAEAYAFLHSLGYQQLAEQVRETYNKIASKVVSALEASSLHSKQPDLLLDTELAGLVEDLEFLLKVAESLPVKVEESSRVKARMKVAEDAELALGMGKLLGGSPGQ